MLTCRSNSQLKLSSKSLPVTLSFCPNHPLCRRRVYSERQRKFIFILPLLFSCSFSTSHGLPRNDRNLYLILGEIINDVYGSNIPISQTNLPLSQLLAKVLNTEHDLAGWVQGLPPSLVPIEIKRFEDGLDNAQIHPFQVILTLRYLNVRTLLHRAVLSHLLGATRSESDTNKKDSAFAFASSSLENCLATAMDTIAMISRSRGRQDVLPVWWYSIYFCEYMPRLGETICFDFGKPC